MYALVVKFLIHSQAMAKPGPSTRNQTVVPVLNVHLANLPPAPMVSYTGGSAGRGHLGLCPLKGLKWPVRPPPNDNET